MPLILYISTHLFFKCYHILHYTVRNCGKKIKRAEVYDVSKCALFTVHVTSTLWTYNISREWDVKPNLAQRM